MCESDGTPFVHELDVHTGQPQRMKLRPSVDGLRIPPRKHQSFSFKLKSTDGIGHVRKVEIGIVVRRGDKEEVIYDKKLVFATILSSKAKGND